MSSDSLHSLDFLSEEIVSVIKINEWLNKYIICFRLSLIKYWLSRIKALKILLLCVQTSIKNDTVVLKILLIDEVNINLCLDIKWLLYFNVWLFDVFSKYLKINAIEVFLITKNRAKPTIFTVSFISLFWNYWMLTQQKNFKKSLNEGFQ